MNLKTLNYWLLFSVYLIATILIYTACKKQNNSIESNSFAETAKNWFENEIIQKEKNLLSAPFTTLPKDSCVRIFARMTKLSLLFDWNSATAYKQNGLQYMVVPVKQGLKPLRNQKFEAARAVIFFQDRLGEIHMNVVEILNLKEKRINMSISEIASISFENKYFGTNKPVGTLSASISFYNQEYRSEISFKTSEGTWLLSKSKFVNKKGSTTKRRIPSTMNQRTTCQTCTTWYTVGFWYDFQTGEIIDYEILDQWEECSDNSPPPAYGDGGGDSGIDYECLNNCLNTANDLSSGVQVVSETESFSVSSIDAVTKYKNPKWKILKNLTWSLYSQEHGVVKLVDIQTNKWQWESLTHGAISMQGFSTGGNITYTQGVGTPSFTPGTQNVLYAGMSLNFDVTYSPLCDCPGISNILAPYTVSYSSNAIWDAKP